MPGGAFPPVGRWGRTSPPSPVRCAATTATLPLSERFAWRSRPESLAGSRRSWSPFPARGSVDAPRGHARGVESAGSPDRHRLQGGRWLSQVPERPLERHAPLSAPGGVLGTRPIASRTAAFRPLDTVGFPRPTTWRAILLSTTIHISGRHDAACRLVPSSSVRPFLGLHVEVTTDLLARRWSGGT
jgi:hypothetical protein